MTTPEILIPLITFLQQLTQSKEGILLLTVILTIFGFMFREDLKHTIQKVRNEVRTRVFGGSRTGGSTARLCPNNPTHILDPNWQTCPYCDAERKSREQSVRVEKPAPGGGKGTIVGTTDTRQIIGALITYSWRPEGQLFPIRAGKNFIGRGEISSEADHRNCDILITQDEKMSGEHALILCQQGRYQIIDQMSSNGTRLNRDLLMANQATTLDNYATIQTGKTVWTFIQVQASQAADGVASSVSPNGHQGSNGESLHETEVG